MLKNASSQHAPQNLLKTPILCNENYHRFDFRVLAEYEEILTQKVGPQIAFIHLPSYIIHQTSVCQTPVPVARCEDTPLPSVCFANPHFQEFVSDAIYLCTFRISVCQELFFQQGTNGILHGTGGF